MVLKQSIVNIKVETDVSVDNEEDVIGEEIEAFCLLQESEHEVSDLFSWFLWWWWLLMYIVCGFAYMKLLRLVDLSPLCLYVCARVRLCVRVELCICYNVKSWHIVLVS